MLHLKTTVEVNLFIVAFNIKVEVDLCLSCIHSERLRNITRIVLWPWPNAVQDMSRCFLCNRQYHDKSGLLLYG